MGVFDKLHNQIGGDQDSGGISPLDLKNLPAHQRLIMRMMLREVELPYAEIVEWAEDLPEEQQISQQELDEALLELTSAGWLIRFGEDNITYEANLRRKAGSALAKSIWANLNSKIDQQRKAREQALENEDPPDAE